MIKKHKIMLALIVAFYTILGASKSFAYTWSHFKGDASRHSFSSSLSTYPNLTKRWTITDSGEAIVNYASPVQTGTRMFTGDPNGSIYAYSVSPAVISMPALNSPLWIFKADGGFYSSPVVTEVNISGIAVAGGVGVFCQQAGCKSSGQVQAA